MAQPTQLTHHIESFVDSARSPAHQAASLDAVTSLVKKDVLTIETLVREMEMYLTTTDNIIRARGILLLGEVLTRLASKSLANATVHSLIGFFTERLADWKALRGALVGCLALMRRKRSGGMITDSDAKAVAQSFLQNLQVQSLGQHDRKLCFELLECLLEHYPDAVSSMGDDLVYGICEAIDGEKDPQCLMLTFHIVDVLARLFPDPSGLLASFASDLFEILACYFPIHFTHPTGEDVDVKRDDLARALMLAFSSTPLFEPFAIPLLLEKLSSSLPSAKVDSLKYLSSCTFKYGAESMAKHARAIWSSLKDTIYTSHEPDLSFASESQDVLGFQENEIATEALTLLQKVIMQNTDLFLNLIVDDEDINIIFNTITSYSSYSEIPSQSNQKLHAVGRILSVSAKASLASCNRVFESFFPLLMDALGVSVRNSYGDRSPNDNCVISKRLNYGALYLCIELLGACRDLIAGSEELALRSVFTYEKWCCLLQKFSAPLTEVFSSTLAKSTDGDTNGADMYFRVKGLQILGTFPGGYLLISKSIFEDILMTFVSIITVDFNKKHVWRSALKALVHIGSFIDRCYESEKALSYMGIVVERIVSLACIDDSNMPFPVKLEAISDIGRGGPNYMLKIVQGIEEAIYANLSEVYVHGNLKSVETSIQLLECYSDKVLPWIHKTGEFEEVLLRFAVNIWDQIENCMAFSFQVHEKGIRDATMKAMKLAVGGCSEESQNIIIQKAYTVLSSSTIFPLKESMSTIQLEALQITQEIDNISNRDEWIHSLFASVIIAVHPQTHIPNIRLTLHVFMTSLLKGSVPAAQALGSMVNKLGVESNGAKISSDCTLEDALDIIFNTVGGGVSNSNETALANLCRGIVNGRFLQIHAIVGLAWIGKGLLMRGHEKVKDITMIFLECLLSNGKMGTLPPKQCSLENREQDVHSSVIKCAADAFQILMGDSEVCLNRKFHAIVRPLYKQRFFSTMMPILQSLIMKTDSSFSRSMLYRAFAHVISDTPLIVVLNDAKKLIPLLLDGLSTLSNDILDKDILYGLLLVLSGILTDKNGQEAVIECAHMIINCLIGLIYYPHKMLVRETAIQCLVALSGLPHTRIYPMRTQVLQAITKALNDPKRAVRQEAVRCRQAWASFASRSLHF